MKYLPILPFVLINYCLRAQERNLGLPPLSMLRTEEDYSNLIDFEPVNLLEELKFLGHKDLNLTLGGEVRFIVEYFKNNGWNDLNENSQWLLQRYMLHVDLHIKSFRVFGQLQSATQSLTNEPPRSIDVDDLDFHQLFIEQRINFCYGGSLITRIGRQEFWLGSRRLISVREGPNVRLSFNAARMIFQTRNANVQAIFAIKVNNELGFFDNERDPVERFWSIYSVLNEFVGPFSMDLYYIGFKSDSRVYDEGTDEEHRHSLGLRFWRNGDFIVNGEAVYQFGSYGNGDIDAYTISLELTKKTSLPGNLSIGLKADIISGDKDRGDGNLQTFNALYPRGAYFGLIALIGPANLIDIHPVLYFEITKKLTLMTDWDVFWRHRSSDGIYGPNVSLERSSSGVKSRYIGHQPGFEVAYEMNRYLSFSFESSYFIAGKYLELSGPSDNVFHLASTFRFKF
jgi:hypothetical protein